MKELTTTRRGFLAATALTASTLLAACGASSGSEDASADQPATEEPAADETSTSADAAPETTAQASKVLVAYFSRADENYADSGLEWLEVGHTKVMAGYIVEALGADEYEIVPKEAYPEGYDDCCDVAKQEQADDARPAIANALPDVAGYDTIFLGCPIWWGDEPMIVRTFLDGVDLSGKTVVPFTTHGGSGLGSVPSNLQAALPNVTVLEGHAVAGTSVDGAKDEVVSWATGLNLA